MMVREKDVLKKGIDWSFERISEYVNRYKDSEGKLKVAQDKFVQEILSFVWHLSTGNLEYYRKYYEYVKNNSISNTENGIFVKGIRIHNSYVLDCMKVNKNTNDLATFLLDYFSGKESVIPHPEYDTFESYVSKNLKK